MSEAIRIEPGGLEEGVDLVQALAVRGLTGTLLHAADHWEVELGYEHEQTQRLLRDVLAVLVGWLEKHELSALTLRVGERAYRLNHGQLESR
jgi:hypothetical protein